MEEEWRSIKGYSGYEVSNLGNVRSCLNTGHKKTNKWRILSPRLDNRGYLFVNLYDENHNMKSIKIHRLVAMGFIPNPNEYQQVNHKDENKLNNKDSNLEWCDAKYNVNYGSGHTRSCLSRRVCNTKAILQYDLDGNLLREFYSISEASRVLDISMGSILDCLKRRTNKSREFIFRYKDNLG